MFERWLVVTDMDGTLLGHHDYDFSAAVPMLEKLEHKHVPVILNTSKTFAEVEQWVDTLMLHHPFIVENGSAIFIPRDYFSKNIVEQQLSGAEIYGGYLIKRIGEPIQALNDFVKKIDPPAVNFSTCSIDQAMALTGLSSSEVKLAQTRLFSVPLSFEDRDEENEFVIKSRQAGFNCLRGGRFVHLQGFCDKGSSMMLLKDLYEFGARKNFGLIALGDSNNDQAMLDQADISIVVRSPGSYRLNFDNRDDVIFTKQNAPHGWVEGVSLAFKNHNIEM